MLKCVYCLFACQNMYFLRPSNTGNIFVQLMAQHCCIASSTSCCPYCQRVLKLLRNKFSVPSCSNMLRKVDPSSTFCNKFFQLATLEFDAWKVEHVVVIRVTTRSTSVAMQQCMPISWMKMLPVLLGLKVAQSSFLTFLKLILWGIHTTTLFHFYPWK